MFSPPPKLTGKPELNQRTNQDDQVNNYSLKEPQREPLKEITFDSSDQPQGEFSSINLIIMKTT